VISTTGVRVERLTAGVVLTSDACSVLVADLVRGTAISSGRRVHPVRPSAIGAVVATAVPAVVAVLVTVPVAAVYAIPCAKTVLITIAIALLERVHRSHPALVT